MPAIPRPKIDEARAEIERQLKRKEKLRTELEEQELWLQEIASQFSGSEEQQRIVGDCLELAERIRVVDDRLRELQMVVDGGLDAASEP